MSKIIDLIATAAALGITGYFLYKVVLPNLKDIQLPTWQFPTPGQTPQLPSTPSAPTPTTPPPSSTDESKEDEEKQDKPTPPKTQLPPPIPNNAPAASQPAGQLLWSSKAWANGRPRQWATHGGKDPDDPLLQLRAGHDRNLRIDGKGTAFLTGDQVRMYIDVNNYNAVMQLTYVHVAGLDSGDGNLSLRLRSHRDESGGFGGYKFIVHRDKVEVAWQTAYQGDNPTLGEKQLPQQLSATNPTTVRYQIRDVGPNIEITGWINYGSGFKQVIVAHHQNPPAVARDKAAFLKSATTWIRINAEGAAPTVPFSNASITSLG